VLSDSFVTKLGWQRLRRF